MQRLLVLVGLALVAASCGAADTTASSLPTVPDTSLEDDGAEQIVLAGSLEIPAVVRPLGSGLEFGWALQPG